LLSEKVVTPKLSFRDSFLTSLRSSSLQIVRATPEAPALAVLPTRCTYLLGSTGYEKLMTTFTLVDIKTSRQQVGCQSGSQFRRLETSLLLSTFLPGSLSPCTCSALIPRNPNRISALVHCFLSLEENYSSFPSKCTWQKR